MIVMCANSQMQFRILKEICTLNKDNKDNSPYDLPNLFNIPFKISMWEDTQGYAYIIYIIYSMYFCLLYYQECNFFNV